MAIAPNKPPLAGRRILVCRPQPRADQTCEALRAAGADARALPLIDLEPVTLSGADRAILQALDEYQKVIAVSPMAAERLIEEAEHWWPQWPIGIEWWGPGPGTAQVFINTGLNGQCPSTGHDTEALLAEPAFTQAILQTQRVLVARGDQGREMLIDGLTSRSQRVDVLPLYRRQALDWPRDTLDQTFQHFAPDTIIALSGETLKNLRELVQNSAANPQECALVVPVERVAQQAREAGFRDIRTAKDLSPQGLVQSCTQAPTRQE